MSNLDKLFKSAMAAASRGRNPNVRKKAISRASGLVRESGGYVWKCIGPAKSGCGTGAVIVSEPIRVGKKKATKKKAKRTAAKQPANTQKRAKKSAAKKRVAKSSSKSTPKKAGKKWTAAARKEFAEKMRKAREAKAKRSKK